MRSFNPSLIAAALVGTFCFVTPSMSQQQEAKVPKEGEERTEKKEPQVACCGATQVKTASPTACLQYKMYSWAGYATYMAYMCENGNFLYQTGFQGPDNLDVSNTGCVAPPATPPINHCQQTYGDGREKDNVRFPFAHELARDGMQADKPIGNQGHRTTREGKIPKNSKPHPRNVPNGTAKVEDIGRFDMIIKDKEGKEHEIKLQVFALDCSIKDPENATVTITYQCLLGLEVDDNTPVIPKFRGVALGPSGTHAYSFTLGDASPPGFAVTGKDAPTSDP